MHSTLSLYIDGPFIGGKSRVEQNVVQPVKGPAIGKLPHAAINLVTERG